MVVGAAAAEAGLYTNIGNGGSSGRAGGLANRFETVIDRLFDLSLRYKNGGPEPRNLCIYLSRVIDHAIWNNEVPNRCQELPLLMKQLYQRKHDTHLVAAIMVLMISVKSACQSGWFSDGDSKMLSCLAKEIASTFGSVSDFITEPNTSFSVISTIISRFYPKMKIGHIFVSLEVKPGFDAYLSDFQISKNLKPSPGETIRLFVVQTNSIETSSCLVSPPKVDFLLNGKGVDKRSDPYVDTGPQLPTVLSNMVKCGPNLLQAVGEFNGSYIIAVAFMSGLLIPDSNALQDYEQCAPVNADGDSDLIEGSSRISLNCPISFKRIKIPVKGHSCKHFQCFDFDNYVDMNSRRPSWRCPHCNQHVCFPDIRLDQKMVKVLQEVGPNVSDVMFCSDGSWNAVTESEDAKHNSEDNIAQNESGQAADVLDLTQTDDAMDAVPTNETEKHSSTTNETQTSNSNCDYWSEILMSTFGPGPSNIQPIELTAGVSLTSPDRLVESFSQSGNPLIGTPNALMTPSALQWNCANDVNSFIQNALSAASQTSPTASNLTATCGTPRQQNFAFPAFGPPPHQNAGFVDPNQVPNMYRVSNASSQQQLGNRPSHQNASFVDPNQVPNLYRVSNASSQQQMGHVPPRVSNASSQQQMGHLPPDQIAGFVDPNQVPNMYRVPNASSQQQMGNVPPRQNAGFVDPNQVPNMYRVSNASSQQQMGNLRLNRGMSQSPGMIHALSSLSHPQSVHNRTGGQQSSLVAAANRAAQMSIDPSRIAPSWNHDGRSSMLTPGIATSQPPVNYDLSDPSWQPPAGRMRGALTGQAYNNAFNQIIARPNAQPQPARPHVPSQVQAPMASGPVLGVPARNSASTLNVGQPMGLYALPEGPSGMQ